MKLHSLAKLSVFIILLLVVNSVNANNKITVAFGEVLAPWVLANDNKGIIVDIFSEAMTPLGYEIEYVYLPYARRTKSYESGQVDVSSDMNLNTIEEYKLDGYFSDIAYSYENYAFSLQKNNFKFKTLSDLETHSVLSWQDAAVHLGEEYAAMVKNNSSYSEIFDQSSQVKMLFLERFEVIQMDGNIFDYYRAQLKSDSDVNLSQKVDRFALLGPSDNGFLFKSEKIRDDFNQQLAWLKSTGKYQKILNRYK